jgi:hypothetical protein
VTLGRMLAISVGVGIVLGGCASVLPFELAGVCPAIFLVFTLWSVGRLRGRNEALQFAGASAAVVTATTLCLVAQRIPCKYVDRQLIRLAATCPTVREVVAAVQASPDDLPPGVLDARICFSSSEPSLREVTEELERQASVETEIGYCGTGASLLFGMHPIGLPRLSVISRPLNPP